MLQRAYFVSIYILTLNLLLYKLYDYITAIYSYTACQPWETPNLKVTPLSVIVPIHTEIYVTYKCELSNCRSDSELYDIYWVVTGKTPEPVSDYDNISLPRTLLPENATDSLNISCYLAYRNDANKNSTSNIASLQVTNGKHLLINSYSVFSVVYT